MSTNLDKDSLRRQYRALRKSLTDKTALDSELFNNLTTHVDFCRYRAVLCYVSFGIEVDTLRLIDYLRQNGIPTYAPKCHSLDSSMEFFAIDGLDSLSYGEYKGILEPTEDESRRLLDSNDCLCIVPALALDAHGYRLGWGGGYYDRFFSTHPGIFKVGITYQSCLRESIPKDSYDVPVDLVVTEKNILYTGR
jgi:5-formyltetrahydrofolate cyclo-ligase